MDHKVKELSVGNGPSGKSILTWQWIPSEGSVSSIDSLTSIEARFSSTESQCSNSQKHANKVLRSESPLWLDEESALELRQVGSSVPERRIDSHEITKQKQLHRIPDMQEHGGVSYEELQSSCVKLMCSFGGKIMPRPSDGKLRYVSGETRIVSVKREIHYSELKSKLRELYVQDLCIKYQLPGEDLDALVSVSSDEDLENMMEEYDRLNASDSNLRLRVFLFSVYDNERASYIDSIGDFRAAENLYVDAVNGLLGSCSEKTMEMVALGDGYSPWESAESAVFSPSHPLRAYDQGLVVQRMVSSQTVSNPSSAPQSAPSSPSFLSRPMMMNRAVLDLPRQNHYDPQMKLKTYSCENAPLEMTNQDDGFSSSASSSNKDLHFQAPESRKSPNYAGSLYHEIRPANFLQSVHTQGDQREEMMSKVISPRKFSNSHEQQPGYRPLVDSFSDFHPVQSLANSQPELQRRFHPQEFPPSGVSLENQCCLDETLSPRVFHSYGKQSHLEEKPKGPQMQANSGLGYPQGLDWPIQQDACAGACSYGEVGDFWYPQGDFKQLPEQFLPQIVFEKPFMHQPELSKLQHDGGQGQSVQGRPEHFPQNGFQEHYCQNSEMCPFHFHKLQSFVEKQPHQDDFCRCHCKLYDPSSHVIGNESSCKFGPSCTCGLGSAPSSPRPSYHDISDRQTRLRLPAQWKHNGALYSDQQFCLRSHASVNQQSTTPFQMSASPPLYAETEKLKECKVCRRHFRFTPEFGVEKQNPNFLPLLCEESFVCEGCYPSLQCKSPGCHTVHCFLQPNTNSYHQEKFLSNHAGEQVPASESHIDLSGKRRDWPFQQKVATNKDESRMVDRLYQNPNSHQERSVNERVENIQKELSGNMLVSNLGTFVDCSSENGHHQVPRRNHLHETSVVPSKFTPYGLNAPARQSTVANKPIIVNGAESCELFPKTIETDSWSGAVISGHESTLQEPEDVVDTFDTQSHEQILSASTNIFSQMPSQGTLKLDSAHCQRQQDLPNHRIKLGKSHIPMLPCSAEFSSYSDLADYPTSKEDERVLQVCSKHHEGTLGRVASIKIDSANMDDCNGTCSTEELNPRVLQPEGPFFQSDDSLKLLASITISSGQQLTRGWGDNAPTKIACSENNPIVTANTTDSLLSTGANHLLTNPSLLVPKIPVNSTSTGEVNCLSNFPERNSIENYLEPFTSPEIHAADDDVKCESFTLVPSFVPEKKTTEVQLFANKALAEDCALFVLGSNGSHKTCGFTEEETLQAGCLVKVDEGARDQVLSQDQSNLLEMPTFSIQAWEEALESVAVKSQADSEEQCDVTKSQVDSEEQCDKLSGVPEPFVENPLPTEEEIVEVFKSEPAQERTNSVTCCSSVETASAAATKAIAGGLQTVKNSDLEEIRELGSGNFGTVYHGKWRGSDVAIKRIKASCFSGRSSEQERSLADFWKEANTLSQLHHPNVVAFYGVVPDGPGGTLATVTEFMVNGSLKQVLQKKDRTIDRRKRVLIAMDAAFGMEYLHGKNIVHFDLKCENLLVNMRDPHRPICKVGDLGLSKVKQQTMVSGGIRGTLPWMAPELLSGNSSMVTEKVDVFSFGIVMWELLTGEEPYANMHYGAIIGGIVNNTLRPPVPNWCDPAWKSLMERCWAADPVRPSFADIVNELRTMTESLQPKHQRPVQTVRL